MAQPAAGYILDVLGLKIGLAIFVIAWSLINMAHGLAGSLAGPRRTSDEKLTRVREMGACEGINYLRNPDWEKEALRLTSGEGVDHIVEVAGGKSLAQSMSAVKVGGTISVIGILEGWSSEIPLFQLLSKQIVLRGIVVGPRRALEDMVRAFERFQVRPVIDRVYPFADAIAAYEHLYRGAFGKIVIRVRD